MADAIVRAMRAEPGSLLAFLPGAAEIRRTQTQLEGRTDAGDRCRRALWRARRRRAGSRHRACAARPAQDRAGDLDRRNLDHHRGRAHRRRLRARARAALRARCRRDAARDRAGVARGGRSAPRPRRPHRAGRLLSAVGRAADRGARAVCPAGNSRRRSVVLRARSRRLGRGAGTARLPRSAAACRRLPRRRRCCANSAPSTPTAASPRKARSCAGCRCRRGLRAWWSMRRPKAARCKPPRSPRSSASAGSAATTSTSRSALDALHRDRSPRARDARAMAQRWAEIAAPRSGPPADKGARTDRRRSPRPRLSRTRRQESRRRRRGAFLLANGRGAQCRCRPRRSRASHFSPSPNSPAARPQAASCSPRRSRSPRSRRALPTASKPATRSPSMRRARSLRGRRSRRLGAHRCLPSSRCGRAERETAAAARGEDRRGSASAACPGAKRSRNGATASCSCATSEGDEWPDLSDAALAASASEWLAPALSDKTAICRDHAPTNWRRRSHALLPWPLQAEARCRGADPFRGADRLAGADRL